MCGINFLNFVWFCKKNSDSVQNELVRFSLKTNAVQFGYWLATTSVIVEYR